MGLSYRASTCLRVKVTCRRLRTNTHAHTRTRTRSYTHAQTRTHTHVHKDTHSWCSVWDALCMWSAWASVVLRGNTLVAGPKLLLLDCRTLVAAAKQYQMPDTLHCIFVIKAAMPLPGSIPWVALCKPPPVLLLQKAGEGGAPGASPVKGAKRGEPEAAAAAAGMPCL